MSTHTYFLRGLRKQTDITQSDIGFLMNLPDYSKVSRWEKEETKPTIEILLLYHLLFDIPMNSLFDRQRTGLNQYLIKRLELLIKELKQMKPDEKINGRIAFLQATLTRLVV